MIFATNCISPDLNFFLKSDFIHWVTNYVDLGIYLDPKVTGLGRQIQDILVKYTKGIYVSGIYVCNFQINYYYINDFIRSIMT